MLKAIAWALILCAALAVYFLVTRVPIPTAFTAPIVIAAAWIGATIVRSGTNKPLRSLCLALGIAAIVALILWLFRTPTTDLWFGAGIVCVVVFGANYIPPRKK